MENLTICVSVAVDSDEVLPVQNTKSNEKLYQTALKPLISYLYAHPHFRLALHFSGVQLDWLSKAHPEYTQLLRELVGKKQVELLGGGYFNPAFPLLFSQDRSGQIELLTAQLTHIAGRRPRGMTLYGSIWDSSLIPGLQTCGMEYILLDSSLIVPEKRCFMPLLVSEQGKNIKVLSTDVSLLPQKDTPVDAYLSALYEKVQASAHNSDSFHAIVPLHFELAHFMELLQSGWFESFFYTVSTDAFSHFVLRLPLEYLHKHESSIPAYVNAGVQSDIACWALVPYERHENKNGYPVTVHNFLDLYPRNHALYNRMLYISSLIAQTHGDKVRRQAAREKLWEAQSAQNIVCTPDGVFSNSEQRQYAYRCLTEAEKFLRECAGAKSGDFKESVTCYDYDNDGYNEYLCRMQQYTACIAKKSGCICELDIMHTTGNYADNVKRIERFDGSSDDYDRSLFVDHLFTEEAFQNYSAGKDAGQSVFATKRYKETAFESAKHEIKLRADAEFSTLSLPVSLRKHYTAHSGGFMLQYILKNEGPLPLKGVFVIESNFAQTDFSREGRENYNVALISDGQSSVLEAPSEPQCIKTCSYVQVIDTAHDISFVYEPNENADVVCMPLSFHRMQKNSETPQVVGTSLVTSLCWNVDLPAGMETEKTIAVTMLIPKKRRSSKKK